MIDIWNIKTEKQVATYHGHTHYIDGLVWLPDDNQILSASENSLRLWQRQTATCSLQIHLPFQTDVVVLDASFSPQFDKVAVCGQRYLSDNSEEGFVEVYRLPNLRECLLGLIKPFCLVQLKRLAEPFHEEVAVISSKWLCF